MLGCYENFCFVNKNRCFDYFEIICTVIYCLSFFPYAGQGSFGLLGIRLLRHKHLKFSLNKTKKNNIMDSSEDEYRPAKRFKASTSER